MIRNGELNFLHCEAKNGGRIIAIEGKFQDFAWIDFSGTEPMVENVEAMAQVRLVIRERKPRHLVVTAYVLHPLENRPFVEVPRGIWE